jgi:hypothetical protein
MGLVLTTITSLHFVLLIDEPEAFLHPPQAYLLGRTLLGERPPDTQLLFATHSSDVVRGLLNTTDSAVHVVRLIREGDINHAAVLRADEIRELWNDPLLKYSNILDGLFNDVVVVCEGDADCKFYGSIVEALTEGKQAPQILFTHSGGKARIPKIVSALRSIRVPTMVIADFDVLQDEQELRRIVEALGGSWASFAKDHQVVKSAIDGKSRSLDTAFVKQEVEKTLAAIKTPKLSEQDIDALRAHLKMTTGWAETKIAGISAVPSGDAAAAVRKLLENLIKIGLFIVPVGELERFVSSVGGHGPAWLAEVYERQLHRDTTITADARSFIQQLLDSL